MEAVLSTMIFCYAIPCKQLENKARCKLLDVLEKVILSYFWELHQNLDSFVTINIPLQDFDSKRKGKPRSGKKSSEFAMKQNPAKLKKGSRLFYGKPNFSGQDSQVVVAAVTYYRDWDFEAASACFNNYWLQNHSSVPF